jgi:hypothetical protein
VQTFFFQTANFFLFLLKKSTFWLKADFLIYKTGFFWWVCGQKRAEFGQKRAEFGQKRAEFGQKRAEFGQKRAEFGQKRGKLRPKNLGGSLHKNAKKSPFCCYKLQQKGLAATTSYYVFYYINIYII